jgi:hypothetical protein
LLDCELCEAPSLSWPDHTMVGILSSELPRSLRLPYLLAAGCVTCAAAAEQLSSGKNALLLQRLASPFGLCRRERTCNGEQSQHTCSRATAFHCPDIALNPRLVNCQLFPGRFFYWWQVTSSCGRHRPIYIPMKSCAVSYGKPTVSKVSSKFRIF